jgi:octaheme c-type cytochrome (tetrathionate reductase family)
MIFLIVCGATAAYAASTADHSRFEELQVEFTSGPEVTKACLRCHTEAAKQIHQTKHWTWEFLNPKNRQRLGKRYVLNNFCITPQSNYPHCTSCHVGYGWRDENFDFSKEESVDCLICHDTTGTYSKASAGAGRPSDAVDLEFVAQYVGRSGRANCGACHFYGGGGNGVKHGDMDDSLLAPTRDLDVHMDAEGENFTCATCHRPEHHQIAGSRYSPDAAHTGDFHIHRREHAEESNAHCRACHGNRPHTTGDSSRLNHHARRIACQTCHIPSIARGGVATRMTWDWSTAGRMDDKGRPVKERVDGYLLYHGKKGSFTYAKDIEPEYVWFNGEVEYLLLNEPIVKTEDGMVELNRFKGDANDGKSRIWPVKVFRGVQPYDQVLGTLVIPQIHTDGIGKAVSSQGMDWKQMVEAGMLSAGQPFSGKVGFINTKMLWPINHMVAPAQNAVGCAECHSRKGRLQGIKGIYIPGRDFNRPLDLAGWTLALLTLAGVSLHGLGRIASHLWSRRS